MKSICLRYWQGEVKYSTSDCLPAAAMLMHDLRKRMFVIKARRSEQAVVLKTHRSDYGTKQQVISARAFCDKFVPPIQTKAAEWPKCFFSQTISVLAKPNRRHGFGFRRIYFPKIQPTGLVPRRAIALLTNRETQRKLPRFTQQGIKGANCHLRAQRKFEIGLALRWPTRAMIEQLAERSPRPNSQAIFHHRVQIKQNALS